MHRQTILSIIYQKYIYEDKCCRPQKAILQWTWSNYVECLIFILTNDRFPTKLQNGYSYVNATECS